MGQHARDANRCRSVVGGDHGDGREFAFFLRGLVRMKAPMGLALAVMMALALGSLVDLGLPLAA